MIIDGYKVTGISKNSGKKKRPINAVRNKASHDSLKNKTTVQTYSRMEHSAKTKGLRHLGFQ